MTLTVLTGPLNSYPAYPNVVCAIAYISDIYCIKLHVTACNLNVFEKNVRLILRNTKSCVDHVVLVTGLTFLSIRAKMSVRKKTQLSRGMLGYFLA